ncbi:MAG: hypothetical protein WBG28_11355, partial [Desulfobulbales bacterium]
PESVAEKLVKQTKSRVLRKSRRRQLNLKQEYKVLQSSMGPITVKSLSAQYFVMKNFNEAGVYLFLPSSSFARNSPSEPPAVHHFPCHRPFGMGNHSRPTLP